MHTGEKENIFTCGVVVQVLILVEALHEGKLLVDEAVHAVALGLWVALVPVDVGLEEPVDSHVGAVDDLALGRRRLHKNDNNGICVTF